MRFSMTRTQFAVAALALAAAGAHAGNTTIKTTGLVANSVQKFSSGDTGNADTSSALDVFAVGGVSVAPVGNATAVSGTTDSFSFPITSITADSKLNIVSGDAKGSGLKIYRTKTVGGVATELAVYIANFTIDYTRKLVLADTSLSIDGSVTKQMPIYAFTATTPLSLKYKFPLTITGHEVLAKLVFSTEAFDAQAKGLKLTAVEKAALGAVADFGTLTQDIAVKARSKAVSDTPYTAPVTAASAAQ
jgi:hypothetical protein